MSTNEGNSSSDEMFETPPQSSIQLVEDSPKDDLLLRSKQPKLSSTSELNKRQTEKTRTADPALYSKYTIEEIQKDRDAGITRPVTIIHLKSVKHELGKRALIKKNRHLQQCQKVYKNPLIISRNVEGLGTGKYKVIVAPPRIKSNVSLYKEFAKYHQQRAEMRLDFICPECGKVVRSTTTTQHREHMRRAHGIKSNKDENRAVNYVIK